MAKNDTVQTVSRSFKILEILSLTPWQGVSELARSLSCQKSTVFRLLNTLKSEGFVIQDKATEKYSLSLKLFTLGANTVNNLDLTQAARPVITRLSQESAETIHLCTIDNDQIVYLQKIESPHSLQVIMMSRIGQSTPFYCTGVGKVLLAYQGNDRIQQYMQNTKFQGYTEYTIVDPNVLVMELEKIRKSGFAYDNEEHELGVRCVAAPVFDQAGNVAAALSIAGPTIRMDNDKLSELRELVKKAAFEISTRIGYSAQEPPGNES